MISNDSDLYCPLNPVILYVHLPPLVSALPSPILQTSIFWSNMGDHHNTVAIIILAINVCNYLLIWHPWLGLSLHEGQLEEQDHHLVFPREAVNVAAESRHHHTVASWAQPRKDLVQTWEGRMTALLCLKEFDDGVMVRRLPSCLHCFHVRCIDSHSSSCAS